MAKRHQIVPKTRGIKCNIHSRISLVIAILVLGIVYITREITILDDQRALSQCNLFSGKWVFDNKSYPLYKEHHCLFLFDGVACERAGRMDLNYQHWRWQPHHCNLPRFNAIAMLERLRDKRLMFVGDTITRNQWASLVCLLESSVPPALKTVHLKGSSAIFELKEYNASIEHYWAPFLVESSSDDPMHHHFSSEQIVKVQAIEEHAKHWTDADILIFNSYIWWRKPKLIKVLWETFEGSNGIDKEVEILRGYEMALKTWLDWLDIHVNRTKTKLYFLSNSPIHESGEKWGGTTRENCYNEKEPISEDGYVGSESNLGMMQISEAAINKLKRRGLNVQFLNITQLSEYRKDAHTSIYRKQWSRISRQQLENPSSYADCINWCIPGVPDVWNELLYAYIFYL